MRQLGKRGVEQPGRTLGLQEIPQSDRHAVEVGRAVFETMEAQGIALAEAQQAQAAASQEIQFALEVLEATRRDLKRLHEALTVVGAYVREIEETGPPVDDDGKEIGTPEDVQDALALLAEITPIDVDQEPENEEQRYGIACPECVQGKHPNCTLTVLAPDDSVQPCACKEAGH